MYRVFAFVVIILTTISCRTTVQSPNPASASNSYASIWEIISPPGPAIESQRITGADLDTCIQWRVCGTDLGIAYKRADGKTSYIFGDTFPIRDPAQQVGTQGWRSPVILQSDIVPVRGMIFNFTGANNTGPYGTARAVMDNRWYTGEEHTVIPNDGISFSETGDSLISFMSVDHWNDVGESDWTTNYASIAFSQDDQYFDRIGPVWQNNANNTDPYQMWSMQRDGQWVYIVTTRAGRQSGPMMLMRVRWDSLLEKDAYTYWNGVTWSYQEQALPIMYGRFGEPSLMKVANDLWVLSYLEQYINPQSGEVKWQIVTQTASNPSAKWRNKKVQITEHQFPRLYGGFLHPDSTPLGLIFFVSTWREESEKFDQRYDVTIFHGTV